jgi:ParB family chromosome partitioning protein
MARNNISDLLNGLKEEPNDTQNSPVDKTDTNDQVANPAIGLATNSIVKRAISIKEPILMLAHDQVIFFKYHDRHNSSLDTKKVTLIRKSIESDGQEFPGVVRKTTLVTDDGRMIYELIVGRIRYEASKTVGVFKAFLRELDDVAATRLMFTENEGRQDITPFERWLSVIPLIKDNIMNKESIAELIGWDPGNLSKSLKAVKLYEDCGLNKYLIDVSQVKISPLIDLATIYKAKPNEVSTTVDYIAETYPSLKNLPFIKAVIKKMEDIQKPIVQTVFLSGCKVKIKKVGDSISLSFDGIPLEKDFETVIEKLKSMDGLR